jgi:proton-coupled amino acid transporter
MKNPSYLRGLSGVLNTGMVMVACLYISTGFYGYLKYGEAASIGAVTLNLPDELLTNSARVSIASAIFLTYPLQFYLLISILVPNLVVPYSASDKVILYEYILRVSIVTVSFLLSLVPYLNLFISVAGAICISSLSLIAPAIIDTATNWEQICRFRLAKNGFIFVFGIVGTFTGTILTVGAIVMKFQDS